ncbi:hypothetical protein KM918_25045 [Priestia megaterium]|uniref:hypothetical protein n=1 Tax=Priestia megaterium TaxID=1404 RepID=UPI001C23F782|nr:hypothetical protein [Priestia megaterium]MBU8690567.1 hypothetical protein [Priestia megaterium]
MCTNYAFILSILAVAPSMFLQDTFVELFSKSANFFYYLLIPLPPVCYLISKVIKKQSDFRDIVKIKNPLAYLWRKSSWKVKIATVLIIGSLLSICFYSYGQQFASNKKEYLVVEINGKDKVVLENNKDNLVVASVNATSGLTWNNFSVIKTESDKDQPLEFKRVTFENGLILVNQ